MTTSSQRPSPRSALRTATAAAAALAALCLSVGLVSNTLGPSPAARAATTASATTAVTDDSGDVSTKSPKDVFVPSLDIVGVRATYLPAAKAVRVVVSFDDLKPVKLAGPAYYKHYVFLEMRGVVDFENGFSLLRNPWASGNELTHFIGDTTEDCDGWTYKVDTEGDTVTMTIPSGCISKTKSKVKVKAYTNAYRTYMDADVYLGKDASVTSGWVKLR